MKTVKQWAKELNLFRSYTSIHNQYVINQIKQIQFEGWKKGVKKELLNYEK